MSKWSIKDMLKNKFKKNLTINPGTDLGMDPDDRQAFFDNLIKWTN